MGTEISSLSGSDVREVEEFLLKDVYPNIYTLGDLESLDERTKFNIARSGGKISGVLLRYELDDYPIIWLHSEENAARELLELVKYEKFVMLADEHNTGTVSGIFPGVKEFRELVMHLHNNELRYFHDSSIMRVGPDKAHEWAKSVANGKEPDHEQIESASEKIKRNDCFGYFMGGEIVARGVVDAKSSHGWAFGGIYTLPQWRGRGFATSIMSEMVKYSSVFTAHSILYVREDNLPAIRAYRKVGFETSGKRVFIDFNTGTVP